LCFKGFKHAKLLVHGLPLGKDPRDLRDGLYIWFATEGVSFAALWKNGGVARTRWQGLGKLRLQGSQRSCRETHLGCSANAHLGSILVRRCQNGRKTVRVWDIMMRRQ